ncbi:MAG: single-stranded-DNA-specific exonuclease RecJ [Anaerolineae bacterium]|nr:single-stranded-DNA-specific exonuclease RecJ [Anaerolineae bacterium]
MNADFLSAIGGHPLVAEILWQRGYTTVQAAQAFLHPNAYVPTSYRDLPDIEVAITRLRRAITNREPIRIWGDFDVDGQTSTSVLLLGLRALGAQADYTIPNRASQNHGLNADGLRQAVADGVSVLLTCDCAVTDFDEVALARDLGLDVIISDHHDLAYDDAGELRLPAANAILNPKRLPVYHPFANLPGVGVAYLLIEGLAEALGQPPPLALLDLVALGIICDVAEQRGDTRYLLQLGLAQLRNAPRVGVQQLLALAGLSAEQLDTDSIGFQIGPRLNSAGRLDTASLAVDLLTAEDAETAKTLALRIETLNQERKILQRKLEDEAFALLSERPEWRDDAAIVLAKVGWLPSVLGVVASSVAQQFQKPAVLISIPVPGEMDADLVLARGSARSFGDIDIHAAIAAQTDLVVGGGGHPMAAGFSILSENINAFRKRLCAHIAQLPASPSQQPDSHTSPVYDIAWKDVTLDLCADLERLAPFGAGNPRPMLRSQGVTVARSEPIGTDGKHQALYLKDASGHLARAVWWRSTGQKLPSADMPCDGVFSVQRNWYRGRVSLAITLQALHVPEAPVSPRISAQFQILDYRKIEDRAQAWQSLLETYGEANIARYGEFGEFGAHLRVDVLEPRPVLAIAAAPAGPTALADLLDAIKPQVVALFVQPDISGQDQREAVLRAVKGMIKVAEKRGDSLQDGAVLARMAARVRQRPATIVACMAEIEHGPQMPDKLGFLLEETRAYRHYVCSAPASAVLARP